MIEGQFYAIIVSLKIYLRKLKESTMKNLKKLVIAIAVLALVASCAVITAFSASVAELELERAEQYYEVAVNQTSLSMKSSKLEALYKFVSSSTTLTDSNADFREFKEEYMAFSVEIGQGYYEQVKKAEDATAGLADINRIFSHFKKCPVDSGVAVYQDYLDIIDAANDYNEKFLRVLLEEACELGDYGMASELLAAIDDQALLVPMDATRWDYHIFLTRYHSILMEEATRLANEATSVLDSYRADADKTYLTSYVKIMTGLTDVTAKLEALEEVYDAAYEAAYLANYVEEDVNATAVQKYDAAYASRLDEVILVFASGADAEYLKVYNETYTEKIAEANATVESAAKAAKTAAKTAYDNAIKAVKAELTSYTAGTPEYIAAALADIAAAAVTAGDYATADELVAWITAIAEAEALKAAGAAKEAYIASEQAKAAEAADKAGDKALYDALDKEVKDAAYAEAVAGGADDATATATAEAKLAEKKVEAETGAEVVNIYVNTTAKDALAAALSAYNKFLSDSGLEANLGSFVDDFASIDSFLKIVALDNAKFLFAEYDKIIANPSDYQYPINSKGNAIYGAYNFLDANNLDSSVPGYTEFYAKVNEAKALYDEELVAAKEALDKQGALDQHDWNTKSYHYYFKDFEDGKIINAYNPTSTSKSSLGQDTVGGKANKYLAMNYGETKTHLYFEPSFSVHEYGIVGDFDVKISEGFNIFHFQAMLKGVLCTAEIFQISSSKNSSGSYDHKTYDIVYLSDEKNTFVTVPNLFTPEVWSHITFTYDPATYTGKLYVNYEFIGEIHYYDHDYNGGTYVTMQRMRIGVNTTYQTLGLDNLLFFSGTEYRDYTKFDAKNMSDKDKFKYYVEYFEDADMSAFNRNTAYVKAKAMYESFLDDATMAEYTKYFTDETLADYYATNIKAPAIASNLLTITEKTNAICEMELNSETTSNVTSAIKDLRNFIAQNVDFIDRTAAAYLEAMARVDKVDSDIIRFSQVKEFTDAVTRFARATTLNSMKKHFNSAKDLYNTSGYGKEPAPGELSNVEYVINDPVVAAFKAKYGVDPFEYYTTELLGFEAGSGDSVMIAREKLENSKKVLAALEFITGMEGYEDTEEFWAANYDYINEFVVIMRKIIYTGNYDIDPPSPKDDPTVNFTTEDILAAVEHFDIIDAYFYELLQNEHIEIIGTQLENFTKSETYIEKVGICSYITKYIEDNADSIDYSRDEIVELIYTLEVYSQELELQEEDYADLLEENTQYFIATITEMQSVITYKELKPLFEKATTFYYGMNTNSKAVKAAMALYDEYAAKLESIEENSKFFIEYVGTLKMAEKLSGVKKQDAIYEALVNAMMHVDGVDKTYAGVANAYKTYTETLAEYNSGAEAINAEINGTVDAVCASRAGSTAATILATIKNIITK